MSRAVCGVCFCPYGDEGDCACSTETHYKKVIDDVQALFDAQREQATKEKAMDKKTEALKLALEALEKIQQPHPYTRQAITTIRKALAEQPANQVDDIDVVDIPAQQQEPKQSEIFCGVDFADGLLFVSVLRRRSDNVAELLHAEQIELPAQQQEPVAIEYWLQDTMESGRWVTTDNMAKATAEKMLSGEYGDVYPQGRIVEPSPPASKPWVGLTKEDIEAAMPGGIYDCLADPWDCGVGDGDYMRSIKNDVVRIVRAIEAKLKEKNA